MTGVDSYCRKEEDFVQGEHQESGLSKFKTGDVSLLDLLKYDWITYFISLSLLTFFGSLKYKPINKSLFHFHRFVCLQKFESVNENELSSDFWVQSAILSEEKKE